MNISQMWITHKYEHFTNMNISQTWISHKYELLTNMNISQIRISHKYNNLKKRQKPVLNNGLESLFQYFLLTFWSFLLFTLITSVNKTFKQKKFVCRFSDAHIFISLSCHESQYLILATFREILLSSTGKVNDVYLLYT